MPSRRPSSFVLGDAIQRPDFTARRDDTAELLDLLAAVDEDVARAAERALARLGEDAGLAALDRLAAARPPVRGRLAAAAGRAAVASGSVGLRDQLLVLLGDPEPKTRRNAVLALGKLPGPGVEDALLHLWEAEVRVDHHRSIAASLGKIGGERSLALLRTVTTDDVELRRLCDQAILRLARTLGRETPSSVDPSAGEARPQAILFWCRAGLEHLLADELGARFAARAVGPGRVTATLTGPLGDVFTARLWTEVGFPLPRQRGELPAAVARALASPQAARILASYTVGPLRYRLRWAGGGHRRALVLRCAKAVAAVRPDLVNDPTESTWEVLVEELADVRLVLRPLRLADPRFAYRRGDVPAASHPTLAAALVRAAGTRPDDVVWDPFVGSGTELVERALAGPYRSLVGSDLDPRAIAVARDNVAAAGVGNVELVVADATTHVLPGVTLILTNPPMGRRVRVDPGALLERFLDHAARTLAPGGRLAWFSPVPRRTAARAAKLGFDLVTRTRVDMGGFAAELQVIRLTRRPPTLDEPTHRS